jgi:subtilase family serine protease
MKTQLLGLLGGLTMLASMVPAAPAADRFTLATQVPLEARGQMLSRLPATNRLRFSVGLPLRNPTAMSNLLEQVYDWRSTNFHRFLTPDQFAVQFGPTESDYERVLGYARSNHLDIVRTFGNRALVEVEGNVGDIETMFGVRMGTYRHPTENRTFYAPDVEPTVASGMPVLFVSGLDNYVIPHPNGHPASLQKSAGPTPNGGSSPTNGDYLGSDFRHAYVPGTTLTGSGQTVGLFERDGYTATDVEIYENFAGLSAVPLHNILNNFSPGSGNSEVVSDIELTIAMAPGLAGVNVYEGNNDAAIIAEMASPTAGETLPNQISCSWAVSGDTSMQQGLIQLALQGQTFLYAIGDSGAYQNGVLGGSQGNFVYMTAVGGTRLFMNGAGVSWSSEIVWDDPPPSNYLYFASTGGVLTGVPIPSYQQGVNMSANQGSTQFRNVPDVALVARDIQIVFTTTNSVNGNYTVTGFYSGWVGTSAAAPLFAGLVALANQEAAQQNKPTIGFLNPAIYEVAESTAYSSCFHDITSGNNAWYNTNNNTSSLGLYPAVAGYDLCTGWGTCAGTNLLNALVGLANPVFVDFNYAGNNSTGGYDKPFKTITQGVNASTPGGTIFIMNGGATTETLTISKSLRITALNGTANIGN